MDTSPTTTLSLIIDSLRDKSEEELKLLYLKFFADDLKKEWKEITSEVDFKGASDEDGAAPQ